MENKKMHKLSQWAYFLTVLVLISACTKEFVEPNLEKKNITVLSPPDRYHSTALTNTFWWDEVDGATGYRLQIVDSNFNYIMSLVLDSLITTDQFPFTLSPGTYQWRVRAENSSTYTDYSAVRTLYIDSTPNLANQTIVLVSPSNNSYTNQLTNTFKWNSLPAASDYRFQLINMLNSALITDVIVQPDSFSYTLPQGQFKWQVRAQNSSSNSPYFSRIINIDTAPPGAPVLNSPADGSTQINPVALSWSSDVSGVGDSVFVYADSLYVTTLASVFTSNLTFNYTGVSTQHYFWRVKTVDNAGNWSGFSSRRKFYVQ
jgi:hypothetical protein